MSSFVFDPEAPLDKCRGESESANQALNDYARMGPRRSLAKLLDVYRKQQEGGQAASNESAGIPVMPPTVRKTTLEGWSTKYRWLDRVAAWASIEKQKDDDLWEERRRKLKEDDWTQGDLLRERAQSFLAQLPRFLRSSTETVERDGVIVQIVTVGLNTNLREIADVLKTASGLQRLAAEEPTDRVQYSGALLDQLIARELEELADRSQTGDVDPAAGDEPNEEIGDGA